MTLDDTIARDLTALAADNRRAWRTADDVLARLDVTPKVAAPRLDALALTAMTQIFAQRVARVAAGGVAMLVILLVTTQAFLRASDDRLDIASLVEQGWLATAASLAVPMLLPYVVARQLAARWLSARLLSSAAPDELVHKLARNMDRWSTGTVRVAASWISLIAGLLYFAFHRSFLYTPWFERFVDGTTRMERLSALPFALFATVIVAYWQGRASTGASTPRMTPRRWLVAGLAGLAFGLGAGRWLELWPIAPQAQPTTVGSWFLTIVGTCSVIAMVNGFALWLRARDERCLAMRPIQATGAARVAYFGNAFARRLAWTVTGSASVLAMAVMVTSLSWPEHYTFTWSEHWPFLYVARDGTRPLLTELLVADTNIWFRVFVAAVAAHAVGAGIASWVFDRIVGRAGRAAEETARHLPLRLGDVSLAAVVAGMTAVSMVFVVTRWFFPDLVPTAMYAHMLDFERTTLHQLALGLALVVALACLLGFHRPRVIAALRHPIVLALGGALAGWAGWRGANHQSDVEHYIYQRVSGRSTYDGPLLDLLGPALILSFTVGAFLVFSWIALRWRGRTASADAA